MTLTEEFARSAFIRHYEAAHGEGGAQAWERLGDGERELWFEAGREFEERVNGLAAERDRFPCPGCESLRRQQAETCGEVGFLAGALSEIARRTAGSGQGLAIAAHGIARDALERLHAGGAAPGAVDAPAAACDASDLEVAGIIVERNRFRDALEQIREIILDAGSSDNGSRLRRSRAVIRAALEDR